MSDEAPEIPQEAHDLGQDALVSLATYAGMVAAGDPAEALQVVLEDYQAAIERIAELSGRTVAEVDVEFKRAAVELAKRRRRRERRGATRPWRR